NVSSPGLDRPLVFDYEFQRNIGQIIKVKLETDGSVLERIGGLKGFDKNFIQLDISGHTEQIDRSEVKEAKIKIKW
ncbi:MAG: hypothetical protein P8X42_12605, partial [Calditrichaceae bacterium]